MPSAKAISAGFLRMLRDDSGVVIYEYAVVLSVFSIASVSMLVGFSSTAALVVQNSSASMQSYGTNPYAFECGLSVRGGC